ncbi:hypothetical protein K493DRAFT_302677 [Basidiobolus meristosporus CBS 931.73]|uniref:Uncharacterized protein n=1 Tax=Basidiobolus meristosporus CBS 931.73 TaxID=1314790 RepID=A0A1Y1Y5S9_9FUNG|nr:hypothetical protein K493DRAFT_302677 [Basidiobolus meristosporus CBS 931.73]|eukprot:ORX93381.1 hypothetical protein K493DRAFT_302677 [Basidiobolus meristosporus CBS 931.73]
MVRLKLHRQRCFTHIHLTLTKDGDYEGFAAMRNRRENFYREQVAEEIKNHSVSPTEKLKTLKMLADFENKSLEAESELACLLEDDQEANELEEKLLARFQDINIGKTLDTVRSSRSSSRAISNVESTTPDELWELLTEEERADFIKTLSTDENSATALIDMADTWRPWWIQEEQRELVTEVEEHTTEEVPQIPEIVTNIEPISSLTPKPPRKEMVYNLVNIMYGSPFPTFLPSNPNPPLRYFDGDLKQSLVEASSLIWSISTLLDSKEPFVFESLDEVIATSTQRSITNTQLKQPTGYRILVLHDVATIFTRIDFILAALSELYGLFRASLKPDQGLGKAFVRRSFMAEKKIYFYLSYAQTLTEQNYAATLDSLIQGLDMHIALATKENELHESDKGKIEDYLEKKATRGKPLIEELN